MNSSKEELWKYMCKDIDEIVHCWNEHGQIFEGEFDFAVSSVVEHQADWIFEIISSNENYIAENDEIATEDIEECENRCLGALIGVESVQVRDKSYMYTIYSNARYDSNLAKLSAENYYEDMYRRYGTFYKCTVGDCR